MIKKQLLAVRVNNSFLALSIFSILLSVNCFAQEKIVFGSYKIPLMVVDEQNGVFVELVKTIAKRANLNTDIVIYPVKRTIKKFLNKKIDVLFPAVDAFFTKSTNPLKSSEFIYVKTDFTFTKKGEKLLKTLPDLKGKRVGITLGYKYDDALINDSSISFDIALSDHVNAKKLVRGNIDAFVVEEKSGLKAFSDLGFIDKIQYDKYTPLSKKDVYVAFQNNEKGKQLSLTVSKILKEMKQDGTFERIMTPVKDPEWQSAATP